ncbi:pyroglutamyl-peptidase I [Alkalibacterium gilvum]|uniref:Pyrrolidone-carboxylate peptidase n=1 Tax=Alkalibacterium gilvum TaxID=1130080 RepID=A0A1H6TKZ8_9LACT|nr:pyroglutamyl-peptidase I [Alkalibacterium gilvum]MDN6397534.1 pyroglutamyl-peptidase I [Alkalibacterium sp.]SEI78854.1 pyroglutamyl-peptidase [Alkalibacterium gilvum]
MKILISGFDPFGGEKINPAYEAVKLLPDSIKGAEIVKLEIPTVFHKSAEVLEEKVKEVNPDVILCIGQAGGRYGVTPERVAINIDDARIPDNEEKQPIDVKIKADGPAAYFSTLPIKSMVEKMREAKVPSSVSNSAGTFVCNHIMYQILYMIDKNYPGKKGGFIHCPFIPEQVIDKPNKPSMNLKDIARGIEAGIEAIVERDGKEDIKEIGGQSINP